MATSEPLKLQEENVQCVETLWQVKALLLKALYTNSFDHISNPNVIKVTT